jgi:hypothetical protein
MKYATRKPAIDLYREFPDLHSMSCRSIRLHPRSTSALPVQASKMGGTFFQSKDESWPCDQETGEQYYPVLQILEKDILSSASGTEIVFPFQKGTDCFQLLWLPQLDCELPPRFLTRWLTLADPSLSAHLVPYRTPTPGSDSLFPKECRLHPEEIVEYPHRLSLSDYHQQMLLSNGRFRELAGQHGLADDPLFFYQTHCSCAPGTKLGGHPSWVQYPEWPISDRGLAMDHLLTVSSCEWDRGDCSRWKPVQDGSPDTGTGPFKDSDLKFGDVGNIYLFVSRRESGWPAKAAFQCS